LRLEAPDALPAKDATAIFPGDSLARDCFYFWPQPKHAGQP